MESETRCTATRCTAQNAGGQQCGNYAGHPGSHTTLIASAFLAAPHAAPREGEPDVFEPLRKLASGPKGDRPDYVGWVSCAEATLMLAHVASQQAALDAAGERYERLRRAVNESADNCMPECSTHGHVDGCRTSDAAAWLEDQQAEIERLRAALTAARASHPEARDAQ